MVATTPENLAGLAEELQGDAARSTLVDMSDAGRNPGRILSLWRQFADHAELRGRPARGIGEPVWQERTADELEECRRHEALINRAFSPDADFWLMCPYNRARLGERALAAAEITHPALHVEGALRESLAFDPALAERALDGDLPSPPPTAESLHFDRGGLGRLRSFVRAIAVRAGFGPDRADDLVFAVNELAANVIRHGGRRGSLAAWRIEHDLVVCEVTDQGRIHDPLVGRAKPSPHEPNGRGLWLVHELCDLVQVRASEEGTRIRVALRADH
jgi:anti-sigma regulatory factor (Ser/Thr protein kinase)